MGKRSGSEPVGQASSLSLLSFVFEFSKDVASHPNLCSARICRKKLEFLVAQ
jgi:hypothetical protein